MEFLDVPFLVGFACGSLVVYFYHIIDRNREDDFRDAYVNHLKLIITSLNFEIETTKKYIRENYPETEDEFNKFLHMDLYRKFNKEEM